MYKLLVFNYSFYNRYFTHYFAYPELQENFAPFEEDGHFLWIPIRIRGNTLVLPHFPQKITKDFLCNGITLFKNSHGLLFFFNSIHAGATVDHFHFQAVSTRGKRFAIQNVKVPTGKTAHIFNDYPIKGIAFSLSSSDENLFKCIERLNEEEIPHNLIMLDDVAYLIPRNRDHEIVSEFPYGVLASMEMAGKFIIADEQSSQQTEAIVLLLTCTSISRFKICKTE